MCEKCTLLFSSGSTSLSIFTDIHLQRIQKLSNGNRQREYASCYVEWKRRNLRFIKSEAFCYTGGIVSAPSNRRQTLIAGDYPAFVFTSYLMPP